MLNNYYMFRIIEVYSTYSLREFSSSCEHLLRGKEHRETARLNHRQCNQEAQKPWNNFSTITNHSLSWQIFLEYFIAHKYWISNLLWFTMRNFEIKTQSSDKHITFQSDFMNTRGWKGNGNPNKTHYRRRTRRSRGSC